MADLFPTLVVDTDAFHAPSVSSAVALRPTRVVNLDGFFVHKLVYNVTFQPALLDSTDAFHVPYVNTQVLQPGLLQSVDVFYAPVATRYKTLTSSLVADADVFRVASVANTGKYLTPSTVSTPDVINAVSIEVRSVLQPVAYASDDVFYVTLQSGTYALHSMVVVDVDVVHAANVIDATPYRDVDNIPSPYLVQRRRVRASYAISGRRSEPFVRGDRDVVASGTSASTARSISGSASRSRNVSGERDAVLLSTSTVTIANGGASQSHSMILGTSTKIRALFGGRRSAQLRISRNE